ncbi:MAG: hypothetical protein JWM44_1477 [Bacilli bacterium]|nr:hypothetical protein [Bacilli bacterium]
MEPMNKSAAFRIESPIFAGMVYSFVIMGIGALIISFILAFTNQKENSLAFYAYIVHAISILIGGYVCGKRTNRKGWYHGGLLGILYAVIIWSVGFLGYDQAITIHIFFSLIAAYLVGAFGGILGVNNAK